MPAEATPKPSPGEFVGPVCPTCGAWGQGLCTTKLGQDHATRRRAEAAWHKPTDSTDPCPEWHCPDLSTEDRREGRTCPDHPCTCSSVQEPEHGPDWSDWDIDHPEEGPSCRCGFNGSPEECAASRSSER